jgi:hypothetical protein
MHTRSLPAQSPRSHHGEGWRCGPNGSSAAAAARRSVTSGATTSSRTTLAIIAALCMCGGVGLTEAKVLRGTIKLTGEAPEGYISKFSINEEGFIEGTLITVNGQPFHTGYVRSLGFSPPVHRRSPRPATGTHCTTLTAGHVCATPSMVPVLPPQCIPVPLLVSLACPSVAWASREWRGWSGRTPPSLRASSLQTVGVNRDLTHKRVPLAGASRYFSMTLTIGQSTSRWCAPPKPQLPPPPAHRHSLSCSLPCAYGTLQA